MDMLETWEENTVFQKVAIIVALAFFMVLPVSTVLEAFGIEFVTERVFAWWWLLTALFLLSCAQILLGDRYFGRYTYIDGFFVGCF